MSENPVNQGRWNHLLKEIPTQRTSQSLAEPTPQPEPIASETQEPIYSVSDINKAIKKHLEGQFSHIWLQGEVSNFKAHTSGHH